MKKFLNKLDIERKALKPINSLFREPQLCGLTAKAIEQWHSQHPECGIEIYKRLLAVSNSVGSLSDRSGERFDEQYMLDSERSEEEVRQLLKLLASQ